MLKFFQTAIAAIKKEISDLPTQLETLNAVATDVKAGLADVDGFLKGDLQFRETGVKVVDKIFSTLEFIAPITAGLFGKSAVVTELEAIDEFLSTEISNLQKLLPGTNESTGDYVNNAIAAVNNARTAVKGLSLNNQQKAKQTEALNHLQVAVENLSAHPDAASAPETTSTASSK